MKIDYLQTLKDSANFAWKYKKLWLFGFLLAITSGGTSTNFDFSNMDTDTEVSGPFGLWDQFETPPNLWLIILVAIIVLFIIFVIFWYLGRVAKVALMHSVVLEEKGDEGNMRIGSLWKGAHPFILKFFMFDLLWLLLALPLIGAFILTIVPIFILPPLGIFTLCCIGIPILLMAIIIMSAVRVIGERYLVLENKGVWESIVLGWQLLKSQFGPLFISWLVMLVPSFVIMIVLAVITFVVMLPVLGVVLVAIATENTVLGIVIGAILGIIVILFTKVLEAPVKVFSETYWTKVLRVLIKGQRHSTIQSPQRFLSSLQVQFQQAFQYSSLLFQYRK